MAGGLASTRFPVVSKAYCSLSQTTLMIRKRPRNINGGGFVAMDTSSQAIAFAVDGCCVLGVNGECMVKDGDGNSILFITKKGGVLQAVSFNDQWRGFLMDFEMASKLVFTLHEAKSWLVMNGTSVKIFLEGPKENGRSWDFEVHGSFTDRACTIRDRRGNVVAEVKGEEKIASKEFYSVVVQPGHDQAFVIAVIAILDYINGESTRC